MFSFVIWDSREKQIFAARDHLGEKPLYYAMVGDTLIAASEIKAVIASDMIHPRLSLRAVDAYLATGYVLPDRSIYENVSSLPPGHYMQWKSGLIAVRRYWEPRFPNLSLSIDDASEKLRLLLKQSIRRHMVSDVPVGAFLSGGLDSSTIVALAQGETGTAMETFTVGFGNYINESRYARLVADKYQTRHHEIDLGDPPIGELFEHMASIYDEPFADSSNIPTYLISQYARRFVKVVLSGDGGDELFGGYCWYAPLVASENITSTRLQWLVLRMLSRIVGDKLNRLRTYSIAAGLACKGNDMWARSVLFNQHLGITERRRLWAGRSQGVFASVPDEKYIPSSDVRGIDRAFYFDLTTYLPGDILVKVDRAAMANGLETRLPFLDRDLVEFALSLPATLKIKDEETKVILRKAFSEYWPAELATRKKLGFSVPVHIWLRRPDMQALARRIFRKDSALRHLLPGVDPRQASILRHSTWILLALGTRGSTIKISPHKAQSSAVLAQS
jgi:asparagine synthase (glutamine-hydrolysing)